MLHSSIVLPLGRGNAPATLAVQERPTQSEAAVLTSAHAQEALTRAYIHAIAGRVGVTCSFRDFDYGIDLTLHEVTTRTNPITGRRRYFESGTALDIQVKSTTDAVACEGEVKYDLEVDAYNDLRDPNVRTPRILVLHVQPNEQQERLRLTDAGLILGGLCYWICLRGQPERPNVSRVRIHIPQSSVFSEASLREIMRRISTREPL